MKLNIIKIIVLMMVITLSSCTDFLEENPPSLLSPTNLYQTETDGEVAVVGVYEALAAGGLWGTAYGLDGFGEQGADNGSFFVANNANRGGFSGYLTNAQSPRLITHWTDLYSGVNRTNDLLANIGNIDASEEKINEFRAEARFIRGMLYYDAVQFYGPVMLKTNPTTSIDDGIGTIRSSEEDVWAQIIEDLEFAEEHLPPTTLSVGRASRWAAKTLLAKAYLARGGYPMGNYNEPEWFVKAAETAYEVISESGISLNPTAGSSFPSFAYGSQFTPEGENSPESIFEIQFLDVSPLGGAWGFQSFGGGRTDLEGLEYQAFHQGGSGGVSSEFALSYRDDDIRFNWNIAPYNLSTSGSRVARDHVRQWVPSKYRQSSRPAQAFNTSINPVVLRMADVYLLFAEASNEATGDPNASTFGISAYEAINVVRARAMVPLLDGAYLNIDSPYLDNDLLYGMDLASFDKSNPNYDGRHVFYTGSLKERFEAAVLQERAWELCFERHRWFDLRRTGKLLDFASKAKFFDNGVLADVSDPIDKSNFSLQPAVSTVAFPANNISDFNLRLPIPDVELQVNPALDLSDQNPGY